VVDWCFEGSSKGAMIQVDNDQRIVFEGLENIERRDVDSLREYLDAKNRVFSFIRSYEGNKFYIHNVDSNGYQFALSTDQTHKTREVKIKTFTKLYQAFNLTMPTKDKRSVIETLVMAHSDKEEFYIYKKLGLIIK
jgi:hypothetical protein